MDCCCCLHELPSLAKPTYAVLSATQAENCHQTAPVSRAHIHHSNYSSSHAARNNKHGPCFKVLSLLPAACCRPRLRRARDVDCCFAHCGSNPRLLDLSQARYHCTSGTAGVIQHHYPIAYMKYRVEILFLVPAAYRFPLLRIFAPDCSQLGSLQLACNRLPLSGQIASAPCSCDSIFDDICTIDHIKDRTSTADATPPLHL